MAQIIAIFSTKGGVGRTFIATNLAVSLSQKLKGKKKVLLLDMDLDLPGDIAKLLNLKPTVALIDIFINSQNYSSGQLGGCTLRHLNSNLYFMPFILHAKDKIGFRLDEKLLSTILEDLGSEYEFIVVDSGRSFNKLLFFFLE